MLFNLIQFCKFMKYLTKMPGLTFIQFYKNK